MPHVDTTRLGVHSHVMTFVDTTADLTTREVAQLLRVQYRRVGIWCRTGKIPGAYQTPGGIWRIPRAALAGQLEATPNPEKW